MYKEKSKITLETEGSKIEMLVPAGVPFNVSYKGKEAEKQKGLTAEARLIKRNAREYEELISKGIVPKHLQHLEFEDAKKKVLEYYIDAMKLGLNRYDLRFTRGRLESGEFRDIEELRSYFEDFFRIGYTYGIEVLAGESIKRVQTNAIIKENSIKIGYNKYVIITDDGFNYIDSENNVTMRMKEKGVKKKQIKVIPSKKNKCDVIYEKENYGVIKIIENGELLESKKMGLSWEDKSQRNIDNTEYKEMSLTIGGDSLDIKNLDIKVAHLYMLLSTNELVLLLCSFTGASIFNIDHLNGIKDDNRMKSMESKNKEYAKNGNLQIITHLRNTRKKGSYEDHIRISWESCYDYIEDLVMVSEMVMQEVDQSTNKPA